MNYENMLLSGIVAAIALSMIYVIALISDSFYSGCEPRGLIGRHCYANLGEYTYNVIASGFSGLMHHLAVPAALAHTNAIPSYNLYSPSDAFLSLDIFVALA